MKIILLSRFCHKKGSRPISPFRLLFTLVPLLALLMGGSLWAGYRWGMSSQSPQTAAGSTTEAVHNLLLTQRDELEETRGRTQEHLDALALRLGQMQSHIMRINALGERLVKMGKLDEAEFNFEEEPARGGIESTETVQSVSLSELVSEMEQLSLVITDRQHKLDLMEGLIRDKRMSEELLPTGRPVEKGWVSSRYGYRNDPFTGKKAFHYGVDVAGKQDSNVVAVASGIVTWAGEKSGFGELVEVRHSGGYVTRYGHNHKILVKPGDLVFQGQPIALMGSSGRSTGPHVHFEIARNGKTIDPAKYLRAKR
ncbi:M23 family metallopeptidase [Sedimenticola hydrogenitrophicus]|uniref:M23 family metallopeptidase n=1 Tax=Sedimenticola hydrogenitrophicus TaxID=2967975 RepID=UPI0023B079D2|nr:M23 family metallopeptidase [Sedimenticola hydrogenitrophicus]